MRWFNVKSWGLIPLLLIQPTLASANLAAPWSARAAVSAPAGANSALQVLSEDLTFECAGSASTPTCRFRATYRFHNPSETAVDLTPVFLDLDAEALAVHIDSQPVATADVPDPYRQFPDAFDPTNHDSAHGTAFTLAVNAGATTTVVVEGTLRHSNGQVVSFQPAMWSRHIAFGSRIEPARVTFAYLIAPIRPWGNVPKISVRVTHPDNWEVVVGAEDTTTAQGVTPNPETSTPHAGNVQQHQVDPNAVDQLVLWVTVPPPTPLHGGPLVGVGGNITGDKGFRMRFGYEIAAPSWLFYSLNVDTDFNEEIVLAPLIQAAAPSVGAVFPSLGAGIGVPILLAPQRTAGIRFLLDAHWRIIGFVATFDLYPALFPNNPRHWQTTLLARFSL